MVGFGQAGSRIVDEFAKFQTAEGKLIIALHSIQMMVT